MARTASEEAPNSSPAITPNDQACALERNATSATRAAHVATSTGVDTHVVALSATSGGFVVAAFIAKVHAMTGHTGYTIRQAAYDLRKLRGKQLVTKPGQTRRYHLDPRTAGTIAALLTLREQVIAPILAGIRSPRMGRKPITWTSVDRDYEKIRIDMQTLFQHLGIHAAA
jgi:hypothetical protein